MKSAKSPRIVAHKLSRPLSSKEVEAVSGGGNTYYYNSAGDLVRDTNYN